MAKCSGSFGQTWGLSLDQFQALNPDVRCPDLDINQSYCVIGKVSTPNTSITITATSASTSSSKTSTSTTLKTSSTITTSRISTTTQTLTGPTPTMPGVAPDCDKFHKVSSRDSCATIEAKYGIDDDLFKQWNTAIDEGCTNLWLNYYVCVHVPRVDIGPTPKMPGVLLRWNTELNDAYTNLWEGYYICVSA
ncbi:hypothetical protein P885DRAFT_70992 [Corynascus similis CBS 632.67]